MSESIEIVIKAANGSIADFKMSAQLDWTVAQVKNHIYRHYPTHPPLTSQRLIHSGRMLLDQQTLLEALPNVRSLPQPVIVHLVAYERSASAPALSQSSTASTTPPTRRRATAQRSTSLRQRNLSPVREAVGGREGEREGVAPPVNEGREQQAQPPHQPQNPWLRHRVVGGAPVAPGAQFHQPNAHGQFFMPMAPGFPPQFAGGFQPPMPAAGGPAQFPQYYHPFGAGYANPHMAQYWNQYNQYPREPDAAARDTMTSEGGEVVEDLDLQNLQDLANNQDVDEQDVPMNAGGLGMMAGGGVQLRHHRDLVDVLYMMTMMSFLALIAYITGSFGRLMVFAGGIFLMLLNQRGWFSLQRRRPAQQREERNPLERAAGQEQEQEERREEEGENEESVERMDQSQSGETETDAGDGEEPAASADTNTPSLSSQESSRPDQLHERETTEGQARELEGEVTEGEPGLGGEGVAPAPQNRPEEQPRPGVLMTIFIFVTSFFTSLVPQQRPELQFN